MSPMASPKSGVSRRKSSKPDQFYRDRLESWHRELAVGDHFAVVWPHGLVAWGKTRLLDPSKHGWHSKVYAADQPEGEDNLVRMRDMNLPVTPAQFALARKLGWPQTMPALRVIVGITDAGTA